MAADSDKVNILNSGISLHQISAGGNTALHTAATEGKLHLAIEAWNQRPELVQIKNTQGNTPLHCAARASQEKMVQQFLSVASSLMSSSSSSLSSNELVHVMNNVGNTALHEAVQNGHFPVVVVLLGVAPSALALVTCSNGVSVLYMAAERCSTAIAQQLLQIEEASCEV